MLSVGAWVVWLWVWENEKKRKDISAAVQGLCFAHL
jgi:hypothetical protein